VDGEVRDRHDVGLPVLERGLIERNFKIPGERTRRGVPATLRMRRSPCIEPHRERLERSRLASSTCRLSGVIANFLTGAWNRSSSATLAPATSKVATFTDQGLAMQRALRPAFR
jgi:hypothetical protein